MLFKLIDGDQIIDSVRRISFFDALGLDLVTGRLPSTTRSGCTATATAIRTRCLLAAQRLEALSELVLDLAAQGGAAQRGLDAVP